MKSRSDGRKQRWAQRNIVSIFSLVAILSLMSAFIPNTHAFADPEPQAPLPPEMVWITERADAPDLFFKNMTDRNLRVDDDSRPHVVYGGDHLYYSRFDGKNWQHEVVDSAFGVGQYAALALDSKDRPHISYYDAFNGALKYAFFDGSRWNIQFVHRRSLSSQAISAEEQLAPESTNMPLEEPSAAAELSDQTHALLKHDDSIVGPAALTAETNQGVGLYTSIAVDGSGRAHISYFDADNENLMYARKIDNGWATTIVDGTSSDEPDVGFYTSIALDDRGRPNISYFSDSNDSLKFARFNGSNWIVSTADITDGSGAYSSIAIDDNGQVHVSHYNFYKGDLIHSLRETDGDWVHTTVDFGGPAPKNDKVGGYSSISVTSGGKVRISYYDFTNQRLKYARRTGSTWIVETAFPKTNDAGIFNSIALDEFEEPLITYYNTDDGSFYLARRSGENWIPNLIQVATDVGLATSLDLNGDDRAYISYYDAAGADVKIAFQTNIGWTKDPLPIPGFPQAGSYTSLKVDSNGFPHIAFYDIQNADLRYAVWNGGWTFHTVDSAGDVGKYLSLALDAGDTPHISYYDDTNDNLKYARQSGASWSITAVDTDGNVGQFTSIAVNPADNSVHISYFDATNKDPKYSFNTGGGWNIEFVENTGNSMGQYTSIALAEDGSPHISYYNAQFGNLRYANKSGGSWIRQDIDISTNTGLYTSIALEQPGDIPHISYYDAEHGDLKYAVNPGGGWQIQTVDRLGDVGLYTSIVLNGENLPRISYYDQTNGDLKYASTFIATDFVFLPLVFKNAAP